MNYSSEETIIYLDKVSAGYDGKIILKDVSFVEKNIVREGRESTGQIVAFLGRSGRGKSTLFKILTGLIKPMEGKVLITDIITESKEDAKEVEEGDVGFVDQKYTLFRHKTIRQACHFALRKNNMPKQEKEELIINYLKDWGLLEHADKYPNELSGGQKQRTAIIEQLLSSKHFIVFDEPFSGLDVGNIEKAKQSFEKIQNNHELNTIIFSTHDINLAVELADSIYVIGHPEGVTEYSTILKNFDLKALGIAWQKYGEGHKKVYEDIKELMLNS